MKSIMHDKTSGTCYFCAQLHQDYSTQTVLEEHHIFGGYANRRKSEKYGLKVYLCPDHHRLSREAVHRPDLNDHQRILYIQAQRVFTLTYPDLDFVQIFGKNYYTEDKK